MDLQTVPSDEQIEAARAFNRFYTRQIGLLDEGLLKSPFSLTEARVLYELAHRDAPTATDLGRDLGIDAGYLSRLLKRFEARGLVSRQAVEADARQSSIALTPGGKKAFAPLDQASHEQVAAILAGLSASERDTLVKAMGTVQRLLGGAAEPKVPYILRPLQVGDIGWIVRRQGLLYAQEYGWDETYEALVAEILGAFVKIFNPKRERAWIAEREGEVVGSVFVVRKSDAVAKLRLLYVEPSARGLGIGSRLVEEVVRFSREAGYRRVELWTHPELKAARKIYKAVGFELVAEETHTLFGKPLLAETWAMSLR